MTLTSIILLILVGLILLMFEILFVPGMVLGFISIILMIVGIIFSYKNYGTTIGTIVLASTIVASIISVYWAFHSSLWKKLQIKSFIDGKANVIEEEKIKIGDTGKTISRLNPMGKAFINGIQVEVQSTDGFIDHEQDIIVVKVQQNKILVKCHPSKTAE
ncbi:MAG: NfeD family protein [Bacteroidota bacterium]